MACIFCQLNSFPNYSWFCFIWPFSHLTRYVTKTPTNDIETPIIRACPNVYLLISHRAPALISAMMITNEMSEIIVDFNPDDKKIEAVVIKADSQPKLDNPELSTI